MSNGIEIHQRTHKFGNPSKYNNNSTKDTHIDIVSNGYKYASKVLTIMYIIIDANQIDTP